MSSFAVLLLNNLRNVWRAKAVVIGTFGFSLLLIVVSSFAFLQIGYGQEELKAVTPGILWLVFLFAGVIGVNHSFVVEADDGALTGLLLTPVDPSVVFYAKCSSNILFIGAVQVLAITAHGVFFGVDIFPVFWEMLLLTLLAVVGFSAVGTLLAAIAVSTPQREIILPLMLFPLLLCPIAGVVFLTRGLLFTGALPYGNFWFLLICAFDVISLTLGGILFEFVVRE